MKAHEVQEMLERDGKFELVVDYFRLEDHTGVCLGQKRNGEFLWRHAVRVEGKPSAEAIGSALIAIGQWMLANEERIKRCSK